MKALLFIFALGTTALAWEKLDLKTDEVVFEDVTSCPVAWFLQQWAEQGYSIPSSGIPFHWQEYLKALDPKTDKPQKWDLVKYQEKGEDKGALVFDVLKDGTLMLKIPVDVQLGIVIYRPLPIKEAMGFLRPHKGANI